MSTASRSALLDAVEVELLSMKDELADIRVLAELLPDDEDELVRQDLEAAGLLPFAA